MRRILTKIYILIIAVLFSSCFKEYEKDYFHYTKKTVEFNEAVGLSKVSNKYYPKLPTVIELQGKQRYRINFFGEQSSKDEQINFRIDDAESTAVEGRDFRFIGANDHVIVPANSSFAYIEIEVLPTIVGEKFLVLELLGNNNVSVMKEFRGLGIALSAYGERIPSSDITSTNELLYARNVILSTGVSTTGTPFIDMRNAIRYFWAGAENADASTINFAYMHSGSTSTNQANLVPPGFSTMTSTWGSAVVSRFALWKGPLVTSTFVKISNPSQTLLDQYTNIASKADIQTLYTAINTTSGRTTGERITRVVTGDLIGYYCPDLNYYAVIKVNEGYSWNEFAAKGILSDVDFYMNFDYKVQK